MTHNFMWYNLSDAANLWRFDSLHWVSWQVADKDIEKWWFPYSIDVEDDTRFAIRCLLWE